jgi:hypothetical protein
VVGKNVVGKYVVGKYVVGLNVGLLVGEEVLPSTGDPIGADVTIGELVILIVIGSTGAPVGTRAEKGGGTAGTDDLFRLGFDFSDFADLRGGTGGFVRRSFDFSDFTGLLEASGTDMSPSTINLSADFGNFEPPFLNVR